MATPTLGGWLSGSVSGIPVEPRRFGGAFTSSLALHLLILAGLVLMVSTEAVPVLEATPKEPVEVVFRVQIGPGGGGGGSPKPAPRREIKVPAAKVVTPAPVVASVSPVAVPIPTLVAPIASMSDILQGAGTSPFGDANGGGGGHGTGIGSGNGSGVGPGSGGGTGGGVYHPGSGVSDPILLHEQRPEYTPDAIRQKLQGVVDLDVTVLPNGTVDPQTIKVIRSLDPRYGLDERAVEAAKVWRFKPSVLVATGQPVAVRVTIEMTFTIR